MRETNMNWANRITITRILLIIPFIILMLNHNDPHFTAQTQSLMRYAAIAIFFLMALSDALDGYLARKKGQATRLGAFLDPMADKLLMASATILLATEATGVTGFLLPITVMILIIARDMFLLIGFMILHYIIETVKIRPVKIGKFATALQLAMVLGILLGPEISMIFTQWIWVLRVMWWTAAATAVISTLIYISQGSKMIEEFESNKG